MDRRNFSKSVFMLGIGAQTAFAQGSENETGDYYEEAAKNLPVQKEIGRAHV